MGKPHQVRDVVLGTGEKIIDAKHVAIIRNQPLAKMRADEPSTAGYQYFFIRCHCAGPLPTPYWNGY